MKTALCDEAWLESLKGDPAYDRLNVEQEFAKMCRWCEVYGKQPTRRRFAATRQSKLTVLRPLTEDFGGGLDRPELADKNPTPHWAL